MNTITLKDYQEAYERGRKHLSGDYYTPQLQAMYDMGAAGAEIDWTVRTGYRYGAAPENGLSWNYADNRTEKGTSMAWVEGMEKEIGSSVWFCDRKKHTYKGIVLPSTGSDDEPLMAIIGLENWD